MEIPQNTDLTGTSHSNFRVTNQYRAAFATTYAPGSSVKIAAQDSQIYTDGLTVVPSAAVAGDTLIQGLVSEDWLGFTGATPVVNLSAASALARGTQGVKVTEYGYHPAALVDLGGAGAVTVTNGVAFQSSVRTAGRLQSIASAVAGALVGNAMLPAAGFGSSIAAGALVQASQTATVAGVPTVGDVYTTTVQIPYAGSIGANAQNIVTPGVAQTLAIPYTLKAADAVSATTAATAVAAALNANGTFAKFYTATSALGVVTVTVNALANPFFVTNVNGGAFSIGLSGAVANTLTFAASAVGIGTYTAGGATLAGGAGFFGTIPLFIVSL